MKAIFYNATGIPVMEETQNARNEFDNGSKAIRKGATHARMYEAGVEIDYIIYHPKKKRKL